MIQPEFLTDRQVAAWLSCSRTTVWELTSQNILPQPIRFGRCTRWRREDLEATVAKKAAH